MMMAGTVLLILAGAGAAIDISMMFSKKTTYQSYADSAALAAAQSGLTDPTELHDFVLKFIAGNNFSGDELETETMVTAHGTIRVSVSSVHNSAIMGMFGNEFSKVGTNAESPLASTGPVEIALVLDITGSMSGDKIASLKSAATGLVDKIDEHNNDNFRVAVVPFRDYVNIGTSRQDETWLELDWGSDNGESDGNDNNGNQGQGNQGQGQGNNTNNGNNGNGGNGGDGDLNSWNGCAGSRNSPWNTRSYAGAARVPGAMNISCGEEILPLTNDMDAVRTKIDSLSPRSWTYIPTGLMWGWRAVDPEAPLIEASSVPAKNKTSVIILMTDGANTKSQNGSLHSGSNTVDANALTSELCTQVKYDGVQIYTVAYELDNTTTLNILRKCASNSDMFFDASNSSALSNAFDSIAENLVNIRLSH